MNKRHLKSNLNILRWLIKSSHGLRVQSTINALLGILGVGLDFAFIYATKLAIDIATGQDTPHSLTLATLLIICIMLCHILLGYARRWMGQILSIRAQNAMQQRLFHHTLCAQWEGTRTRHTGDLLNRLERDVRDITLCITDTLPSALTVGVRFIGAFWFLFSMDPRLALLLCIIAPAFILCSRIYVRRMRIVTGEIRNTDSAIQSLMQESLTHNTVIKTLEHEQTTLSLLCQLQTTLLRQVSRRTWFSTNSNALINMGFSIGYLITFIWSIHSLQEKIITYGTMLAFIQLIGQIQSPFRDMLRFMPIMIGAFTAGERLMEIEETKPEEKGSAIQLGPNIGIRLSNISYAYPEGHRNILDNFSYDFAPGTRTAILGETGAGKTTLVRLILSLIHPQQGTLEIYDNTRSYYISPMTRGNIVYVPQGNTLFSGTIRSNLLMGNPKASEQEMEEALNIACAHFVKQLPLGLETPCGENGTGLSEGQMQRICIARALLRKGNILLFDEATSALDSTTEEQLLNNLCNWLTPKQTLIFITHRLSVTQLCPQQLHIKRNNK